MDTFRKWLNKPKADDKSLLARFYHADKALTAVASELDSFDGRAEPDRCSRLVSRLRQGQDKVLSITNRIMEELLGEDRAPRAFRAKFPEEVLQENLAGQLWFGAECLAAGSSIMNRELESTAMRPLAQAVTKSLDNVRNLLRDQCLRNNIPNSPILKLDINDSTTEQLYESLKIFDRLFAEFELRYVSAMVQVKSKHEYEMQELICVLFSETLQRALINGLLEQDQVDSFDPALMFSIPRLAIITGLVIYRKGPLNMDMPADQLSEMFRPFRTILIKIRELLRTLTKNELQQLERLLCTNEEIHLKICDSGGVKDETNLKKIKIENCKEKLIEEKNIKLNCDDNDGENNFDKSKNHSDELVVSKINGDNNCNSSSTTNKINQKSIEKTTAINSQAPSVTENDTIISKCSTSLNQKRSHRQRKRFRTLEKDIETDEEDDEGDVVVVNELARSPGSFSTSSSATTADVTSDWTDEENKDLEKAEQLVTSDCATGFLIPNTNFGNLLQSTEDPLTDNFIASDDEFGGNGSVVGNCSENIPINRDRILNNNNNNSNLNNNVDSGISTTENTSSDRTPDSDNNKTDILNNETTSRRGRISSSSSTSSSTNSFTNNNSPISTKTSKFIGEGKKLNSSDDKPCCSRMDTTNDSTETDLTSSSISTKLNEKKKSSSNDTTPTNRNSTGTISTTKSSNKNNSQRNSSQYHNRHNNNNSSQSSNQSTNREQHHNRHHSRKQRSKNLQNQNIPVTSKLDRTSSSSSLSDGDPHEVSLALRAAGRMKFKNTENLLHRLFVCIAGVADQLQTNFASDLRQILRSVFLMNTSPPQTEEIKIPEKSKDSTADLFEFRASENDVIHQESNGGSNQSIYSAEEVNVELDNVFANDRTSTTEIQHSNNNNNNITITNLPQRGNSLDLSAQQQSQTTQHHHMGRSRSLGEEPTREERLTTTSTSRKIQLLQERRRLSSQGSNSAGSNSPINSSASSSPINERSMRTNNSNFCHRNINEINVDDIEDEDYDDDQNNINVATTTTAITSNTATPIVNNSSPPMTVTQNLAINNTNRRIQNRNNDNNHCMPKPSPPAWIPDDEAPRCMSCTTAFTAFRRRHHCRNCGGVFCGGCSNSSAPLPKYGLTKAVRVCRDCYVREVVCST